ncbi:MAG: hypothetical protein IPF83_11805 [Rhodanobacteraceae bacterium]|jgi:hypothetical protein|nr:hypothetical protein [Rhodanobacteraceae bacterium]MBK7044747.1 hypothetical protein [Rhodanobacteraceae bacterium]MBP9153528.1 hypothetical protein [Xanthomonadales bacterium]HQW81926.1 hypothetical protein [Pseudomonadota bacterium]
MLTALASARQYTNTESVSLAMRIEQVLSKLLALVLVLVLITPSPERDECLT